ncbi:unnamed protein product, partial [marine sediment metagenome]
QMMRKLPRFLLILTPAIALVYGIVLSDVIGLGKAKNKKKKKLIFRIVSVFLVCALIAAQIYFLLIAGTLEKKQIDDNIAKFRWGYYDVLKDLPHKPVYSTGGWWFNRFSFYFLPDLRYMVLKWRSSEMLRDLREIKNPSELADSYVIIKR